MDKQKIRKYRLNGQSTIEMIAGVIVIMPVILFLFDLAVVLLSVQVNDAACRDAARAAAAGPPSQLTDRANTIVNNFYKSGGYISKIEVIPNGTQANITATPDPVYGGPYTGTAQVTTKMTINVPVTVKGILPTQVQLNAVHSMPITYIAPNTSGAPP